MDIECIVEQNDGYAAVLDSLVAQVETIVAQNCFAGNAKQIYPTSYGQIADADGEVIAVRGTQSYQIFYLTSQVAPGTTL